MPDTIRLTRTTFDLYTEVLYLKLVWNSWRHSKRCALNIETLAPDSGEMLVSRRSLKVVHTRAGCITYIRSRLRSIIWWPYHGWYC